MRTHLALLLSVALSFTGCSRSEGKSEDGKERTREVVVAGASDLVFAMDEIIPLFEKEHRAKVKFIAGSSGNLAAQLGQGAPYDVFFSANERFVDDVVSAGSCDGQTKAMYARGRIALWTPEGADPGPPADVPGLTDGRYRKIAIANPEHAPYGKAAQEAMQRLEVWDTLRSRLLYGQNIKDAMQLVETRNAEVGVIALSLAIKAPGSYELVPEELHAHIDQFLVACTRGPNPELGRTFAEYLSTPAIREVMESYGFVIPEGAGKEQ
jgi:molybdate transport system substrate-binding protein